MAFEPKVVEFFEKGFTKYDALKKKSQPKVKFWYKTGHDNIDTRDMLYVSRKVFDIVFVEGVLKIEVERWDKTNITLYIMVGGDKSGMKLPSFNRLIEVVCMYVVFLNQIRRKDQITIVCAFSNKKKTLPTNVDNISLGVENVNSGFSVPGYIMIYRSEEFYKVMLHELIHSYGFHDNVNDVLLGASDLAKQYNISHTMPIQLFESYVEVLTSVWMIMFKARKIKDAKKMTRTMELKMIKDLYNKTVKHMIERVCMILRHYGRSSLHDTAQLFHENTHVFSYYIVKAAIMVNLPLFQKRYVVGVIPNTTFNKTYGELIRLCLRNLKFHELISKTMNKANGNSLRMMPFDL